MNQLTRAAKTLSLIATLALSTLTFASGCALDAASTDELEWSDDIGATDGSETEEVGEGLDELTGAIWPDCGYCSYWSPSKKKCLPSELNVCGGDGG